MQALWSLHTAIAGWLATLRQAVGTITVATALMGWCLMHGSHFAQADELDLDKLLSEAQSTKSPLEKTVYCEISAPWLAPVNGENKRLRISLERACFVDGIDGIPAGDKRMLVLEGTVTNLAASPGFAMPKASAMLRLGSPSLDEDLRGMSEIEETINKEFAGALLLYESKDYVVAYRIDEEVEGRLTLEHPAASGPISILIGNLPPLSKAGPENTSPEPPRSTQQAIGTSGNTNSPAGPDTRTQSRSGSPAKAPEVQDSAVEELRNATSSASDDTGAAEAKTGNNSRKVRISGFDNGNIQRAGLKIGPAISRIDLGGRLVVVGGSTETDAAFLNNGIQGFRNRNGVVGLGKEKRSRLSGSQSDPFEAVFTFRHLRRADIHGFSVNSLISQIGNKLAPTRVGFEISEVGPDGPWTPVVSRVGLDRVQQNHLIEFDRPVSAKAVKI